MKQSAVKPAERKTFRDKYLAVVIAMLAFFSLDSFAQDAGKYSPINGYGFRYKRHVSDSIQLIPLSTSPHVPYRAGAIRYNESDSTLEIWTGSQWIGVSGGGGSGIDSLRQNLDSVKLYTGGIGTFQFHNKNTDTTDWYNAEDYGMIGNGVFDNTNALQTLINNLAVKKRNAIIYFPDTVYSFSGILQDTSRINSVIIFPSVSIDSIQYTITLKGKRRHTYSPSAFVSSVPFPEGTILRYTLNEKHGTEPSFLGGKGPVGGDYDETSYMVPSLEDLTIQMPDTTRITAVNFRSFTNTYTRDVNIVAGNSQSVLDKPEPTDSTVYGYIQPDFSHGVNQICEGELNISGFYNGIRVGEGSIIDNLNLYSNKVGIVVDGADGSMYIKRMIVGWHPIAIKARTGYTKSALLIDSYNAERWVAGTSGASAWYDFVADVYDPNNQLISEIRSRTVIAGIGTDPTTACFFTKTGGTGVYQHCQGSAPTIIPAIATTSSDASFNALDITNTSTGTSAIASSVYKNNSSNVFSFGVTGTNYTSSLIQGDQGFFYSSASNGIRLMANHASGPITFLTGASTSPSLTISASGNSTFSGNVGIGTSPSEILHINKNANSGALLRFDNLNAGSSAFSGMQFQSDGGSTYLYRTSAAYGSGLGDATVLQDAGGGDIIVHGAAEIARFKNGGHFLVGTTSDNGALGQFNGDVTVADDAYDATGWNGNVEVPTKNAIRDKIEAISTVGSLVLVNDADYTVASGVSAVRYHQEITNVRTLTLPDASANTNREIWVKANNMTVGTGQLTITSVSNIYLDGTTGSTTQPVNVPGSAFLFKSDGTSWFKINQ